MRRLIFVFLTNIILSLAFADGFGGTKTDPVGMTSSPAGAVGAGSIFQTLFALILVGALVKFVLPKLASKFNKRLVTNVGSDIRVEESAVFAGGSLYVVSARGKSLLLSVAATGVTCLADLTDSTPAAPSVATFQEILETAPHVGPGTFAAVHGDPAALDVEAALARLDRFAH